MECKLKLYILFIDLSKAFDSVDHQILMLKLRKRKIPETTINLIQLMY